MTTTIIIVIILSIICSLLIGGGGVYFFLNHSSSSSIKDHKQFQQEQAKILAGLTEKKDAAYKEIHDKEQKYRDELLKERAAAIKEIEQAQDQAENQYKERIKQLADNYAEYAGGYEVRKKDLETQYRQLQQDYKNKELTDAAARKTKLEDEIKTEQSQLHSSLAALQSDYKTKKENLDHDFFLYSEQINLKKEALNKEIKAYENKQQEIIARFKLDEERREQVDFYRVKIGEVEKADIAKLRTLALSFSKPSVIYKVIWESYYKAPMEAMFKRVLGDNTTKGGIYKITNIDSQKVYIGRTVKFLDRFRTHAKRGCGIDKINGILYDEMMKCGLDRFTWEIVEVCDKDEQSVKEKYWISFYHSDEYGYNQNKGG